MILMNRRSQKRFIGNSWELISLCALSKTFHLLSSCLKCFYSNSIYAKVFWFMHCNHGATQPPNIRNPCFTPVHMSVTNMLCLIAMNLKTLTVKPSPKIWVDSSSKFALACSPFKKKAFLHLQYLNRSLKMTPGVSSYQYTEGPQSISFSGSGFLATYQLGVAQCFLHYAPWILHSAPSILGSSAGSLVAAAVVCEMNLSKWLFLMFCNDFCWMYSLHIYSPNPLIHSYHSGWDDSFCQGSEVFYPWTTEPLNQAFSLAGMYFKQASSA